LKTRPAIGPTQRPHAQARRMGLIVSLRHGHFLFVRRNLSVYSQTNG
jgi:hypothetical protein